MKEIGKLLELLNEYHHFNSDLIYYGWDEECEKFYFHTELPEEQKKKLAKAGIDDEGIDEERVYDEWLCSKQFGFIKWLVEHNKLLHPDFVQHLKLFYGDSMPEENFYIMMLAIAPNPIEELCKMLRPY